MKDGDQAFSGTSLLCLMGGVPRVCHGASACGRRAVGEGKGTGAHGREVSV